MRSTGVQTDHFPPNQLWYPLFAARTAIGTCSKRQSVFHQRQARATSAEQMTLSSLARPESTPATGACHGFENRGCVHWEGRTVKVFSGAKLKLGTHSVMSEQPSAPETTAGHRHVKSSHGAATLALGPAGGPTTTHRRSRHSRGNGCGRSRWWPASGCRPAHGRGAPTVRLRSALLTRAGRDAAAAGGAPCRRCGSPASPPCRGSPSTP